VVLMAGGRVLEAGSVDEILSADKLSATFGVAIHVAMVDGRPVVLLPGGRAGVFGREHGKLQDRD
jgi:ABC-type cobalamin transport system ATPase subunit